MKWKCKKCGQVVTSPPLNNDCPKGGSHSWANAKSDQMVKSIKLKTLKKEMNYGII